MPSRRGQRVCAVIRSISAQELISTFRQTVQRTERVDSKFSLVRARQSTRRERIDEPRAIKLSRLGRGVSLEGRRRQARPRSPLRARLPPRSVRRCSLSRVVEQSQFHRLPTLEISRRQRLRRRIHRALGVAALHVLHERRQPALSVLVLRRRDVVRPVPRNSYESPRPTTSYGTSYATSTTTTPRHRLHRRARFRRPRARPGRARSATDGCASRAFARASSRAPPSPSSSSRASSNVSDADCGVVTVSRAWRRRPSTSSVARRSRDRDESTDDRDVDRRTPTPRRRDARRGAGKRGGDVYKDGRRERVSTRETARACCWRKICDRRTMESDISS